MNGLSFDSAVEGLRGVGMWVMVACAILSVVLAIVVYVVAVPHDRPDDHEGSRSFFNFDKLIIAPIFKFAYVLASVALLVFGIASIVSGVVLAIRYSYGDYAWGALAALVVLCVGELALRLVAELLFLFIKLVTDVSAIRGALSRMGAAGASHVPQGDARGVAMAQGDLGAPAAPGGYAPAQPPVTGYDPRYAGASWADEAPTQGGYDYGRYGADYAAGADAQARRAPSQAPVAGQRPDATGDVTTVMTDVDVSAAPAWDCPTCGNRGNVGDFCPRCGSPRP